MKKCHIPECGREALPNLPVCAPCRLSYLNGILEAQHGAKRDTAICEACGHFVHPGTACGWHGGSCDDAQADESLWCPCNTIHPRGPRPSIPWEEPTATSEVAN